MTDKEINKLSHREFEEYLEKHEIERCHHCGSKPSLAQWRDTVKPNATWIECKCGIMTKSFYGKSFLTTARKAIKCWNRSVSEIYKEIK